jgi:hypothetical protein
MDYAGHIYKSGDPEDASVDAIRARLARRGYSAAPTGAYDGQLASLVSLFQTQHVDLAGRPLKVDGEVGPNTWGSLFGPASVQSDLLSKSLAVAEGQVGTMETPPNSNSGPRVNLYLGSVGLGPGHPWCMAFVHWCFAQVSAAGQCPVPPSGGVLDVWNQTQRSHPNRVITKQDVIAGVAQLLPGHVFIHDHGNGFGHTGILKSRQGGGLVTVEGNTNIQASSEGVGVFELTRRSITDDQLVGYIDFNR